MSIQRDLKNQIQVLEKDLTEEEKSKILEAIRSATCNTYNLDLLDYWQKQDVQAKEIQQMKKWITVHTSDNNAIRYINVDKIVAVYSNWKSKTLIDFDLSSEENCIYVSETPEEVMHLIHIASEVIA